MLAAPPTTAQMTVVGGIVLVLLLRMTMRATATPSHTNDTRHTPTHYVIP
jgi:hypothetical protein